MKENKIVIVTKQGRIIKFLATDVPTQCRGGIGIKPMMLRQGDEIVSMVIISEDK